MTFIEVLKNHDTERMKHIPKGDLHNHITRGGNKKYIEKWSDKTIPNCPKFNSLDEMNDWNQKHIKPLLQGREGYEKRIEASFVQAQMDGIKVLHMSVSLGEELYYDNSVESLVKNLNRLHQTYAHDIKFIPEIAGCTYMDDDEMDYRLDQFLDQSYFKSFDMFGDESKIPTYKKLYKKLRKKGLILKAHVGEFGTAELVREAVEALELDHVQHGIAASNSKAVMTYLRDNHIQLNICPSSNVLLNRAKDYKTHPIKKLYDNGIKVTINSDDMLIFDQSVSDEYFNLYHAGVFSPEELNDIRKNSLF